MSVVKIAVVILLFINYSISFRLTRFDDKFEQLFQDQDEVLADNIQEDIPEWQTAVRLPEPIVEVFEEEKGERETWKGVLMDENRPFKVSMNIEHVSCWEGAFKGTGTLFMKVPQPVTIEGTLFKNGDIYFVLTVNYPDGIASWREIASGRYDEKMIRGTRKVIDSNVPLTMNIHEGGNWVWSSSSENAGNNESSEMSYGEADKDGWMVVQGKSSDTDGDKWKMKGRMNKNNGKVYLKSIYKDGKTWDFEGTKVGNQVKGYIKTGKSFTGSFELERVMGKM